jgi:hypothetical protein
MMDEKPIDKEVAQMIEDITEPLREAPPQELLAMCSKWHGYARLFEKFLIDADRLLGGRNRIDLERGPSSVLRRIEHLVERDRKNQNRANALQGTVDAMRSRKLAPCDRLANLEIDQLMAVLKRAVTAEAALDEVKQSLSLYERISHRD